MQDRERALEEARLVLRQQAIQTRAGKLFDPNLRTRNIHAENGFEPMAACQPSRCSGLMYAYVPMMPAVAVAARSPKCDAPKSESRAAPAPSKRTFDGFTSR